MSRYPLIFAEKAGSLVLLNRLAYSSIYCCDRVQSRSLLLVNEFAGRTQQGAQHIMHAVVDLNSQPMGTPERGATVRDVRGVFNSDNQTLQNGSYGPKLWITTSRNKCA